ncbi:MAG: hypothetical protein MUE41_07025 [Gemmatimonadaceae bacterium]|jgi:hypothetical protein|nr:hypothetical protein [Gemmatimonadaceae bacterium]
MRPTLRRFILLVTALPLGATVAHGQLDIDPNTGICRPRASSNEAKLLAFYSAPFAFSGMSAVLPTDGASGVRLWIGGEATAVPTPAASVRTSDRCYGVRKTENTNLAPVLPRPRVLLALPGGFSVEASYLPPVTVFGATPNVASAAVSWATPLTGKLGLLLRAHGTFGTLEAPITCSDENLQQRDPGAPCFGTNESADRYSPNILGAEGALTLALSEKIRAFAGAGYNRLESRFEVNFQGTNNSDDTRIELSLSRVPFFGGVNWLVAPRFELSAQAYSIPQDLTTVRFGAMYRLR